MKISILSVFPSLYEQFLATSLMHRAQEKGLINVNVDSFFSFVSPKERIDAPTFGHGAGMVLRPDVVEKAIETKQQQYGQAYKIFFSPHGKKLDQDLLNQLFTKIQAKDHLMLVAGRYEGMDVRVEQVYADEIISIGDLVLMGGDIPSMVLLEGLLRLIPGVVGKEESVVRDSFTGPLVDYPEYTAPVEWHGLSVPEVVRSGHHAQLQEWREQQAMQRTVLGHFDWFSKHGATDAQKALALQTIPPHYVILTHEQVFIGRSNKQVGTTSVTSIDIHDIARSCATYGIKRFFLVTPLKDQQAIVKVLLDFWQKGVGIEYNKNRHDAVKAVQIKDSIEQAVAQIEEIEGRKPLVIATSARDVKHEQRVSFNDHNRVWDSGRPVLLVFGTGQGLVPEFIDTCDFLLPPVGGLTNFRHLSVRSAVAVVLDRWLGISYRK